MNRKRSRTKAPTTAATSTKQSSQQQYFRYVAAPEDNADETSNGGGDGSTTNTNPRYVGGGTSARGSHQRKVDEVDVPAPTEWLCHDAAASARLRTDAQTDLQLYPPRRPHHLPHSARQKRWMRDPAIGVAVARTLGSSKLGEDVRQERVICGGEVLPWGTWPARLRHHEGQSFYGEDGGSVLCFHASGGSVGRSGGVGGVGGVSEGSIHDELLRRQLAPAPSSSLSPCHQEQEENVVTRLVPDKRGRWVESRTRITPHLSTAAASSAGLPVGSGRATSASAGFDASPSSLPPSLPPPRPSSTSSTSATVRLIPGRYGGWVEFEESGKDRAHETVEQRQNRRAAASMTASFGPDDGGGGGGGGSSGGGRDDPRPASNLDDGEFVRRTAGAKKAEQTQRRRPEECTRHQPQARTDATEDARDQGTGGGALERGSGAGTGAASEGSEGERRKRRCDTEARPGAGASAGGFDQGHPVESGGESDGGCHRRGWTVSEPAKETVRRVWNRARRRARDSSAPVHRAPPQAADDDVEDDAAAAAFDDAGAPSAVVRGTAIRDQMDPALLSCLGRECEGIMDAALHVLLADRLRRLQPPPVTASSSTEEGMQSAPSPPPPPPPPQETADWQDVLRAMRNCSDDARGSVHLGEQRAARGRQRYGGDGVPGRGAMEKEAWGKGGSSDGSVVVVNERLPGLPLNEAVLTRAYNRLLLYLHEKRTWQA